MFRNKRGQISIEFLLVLSVLVVGGVLFGVYYLQSIEKNKQDDLNTDVLDYLITDFKKDVNIHELPPNPNSLFSISLSLDPIEPTEEGHDFNVIVHANNQTEYEDPFITDIYIFNSNNEPTSNCKLVTLPSNQRESYEAFYTNLNYYFLYDEFTLTFNCNLETNDLETYTIEVIAKVGEEPSYIDNATIDKDIYSLSNPPPINESFEIYLELYPDTPTPENSDFAVVVSMDNNTSYKDPMIKTVEIKDNEAFPTENCLLIGANSGDPDSTYENLDILLKDNEKQALFFNCSLSNPDSSEIYSISVSAEIDSNSSFSATETIDKNIIPQEAQCIEFTGDIVFSIPGNLYNNDQNLTLAYINDSNCQGDIYYTLDNTDPTIESNKFTGPPISLTGNLDDSESRIVKAKVFGTNDFDNEITLDKNETYVFKVATPVPDPLPKPQSATFYDPVNVALSTETENAVIKKTLISVFEDFDPNNDTLYNYTEPIYIDDNNKLIAIAEKEHYLQSDLLSAIYMFADETETEDCPDMPDDCEITGTGSAEDPFLITSSYDFYCVRKHQLLMTLDVINNDLQEPLIANYCYYTLTDNIDLDPTIINSNDWCSSENCDVYGFPSIGGLFSVSNESGAIIDPGCGLSEFGFYGSFDGNNHTIENLNMQRNINNEDLITSNCIGDPDLSQTIYDEKEQSLFGDLLPNSEIKNLKLTNITVENTSALVKEVSYSGTIENVEISTATITFTTNPYNVGGLVWKNNGYIRNISLNNFTITRDYTLNDQLQSFGGIVGRNSSNLSDVHFSGTIKQTGNIFNPGGTTEFGIGGIAGINYSSATIERASFNGDINTVGYNVGGIAGLNSSSNIKTSFSSGSIKGVAAVGGIVGQNKADSEIINSYSAVTLKNFTSEDVSLNYTFSGFGGLVGFVDSAYSANIINSYSISDFEITPIVNFYLCGGIGKKKQPQNILYGSNSFFNQDIVPDDNCGHYYNDADLVFWDLSCVSPNYNLGIRPLSSDSLKNTAAEYFSNWNFNGIWTIDTTGSINEGYPYLINNSP